MLQKLLEAADGEEVLALAEALLPHAPEIMTNAKGVYVVRDAVAALQTKCMAQRGQAMSLAGRFCSTILHSPKLMQCIRMPISAKVAVDLVALGLPTYGALLLGSEIAGMAEELAHYCVDGNWYGLPILLELVRSRASDPTCDDLMRDLVCLAASYLQGNWAGLLTNEDERGAARTINLEQRSDVRVRARARCAACTACVRGSLSLLSQPPCCWAHHT